MILFLLYYSCFVLLYYNQQTITFKWGRIWLNVAVCDCSALSWCLFVLLCLKGFCESHLPVVLAYSRNCISS